MKNSYLLSAFGAFALIIAGALVLSAPPSVQPNSGELAAGNMQSRARVVMYKDPYCGCCGSYAAYLRSEGFGVAVRKETDMGAVKDAHGVPAELESCHTMELAGYTVEGHVPLAAIEKLLAERPDIAGIALAGMPDGSPGMGGEQKAPFEVKTLSGGAFMAL